MKGHFSNTRGNPYRARTKTKTVHGIRTGHHDNPNVMRSVREYGGTCDGESKRGHLGKMGRLRKRDDGGRVMDSDAERARESARERMGDAERKGVQAGALTMTNAAATAAARKIRGPVGHILRGIGLAGTGLGGMDLGKAEMDRQGAERDLRRIEGRADGGSIKPPVGSGGSMAGAAARRAAAAAAERADGGSVGEKALALHALEHKKLAEQGKD